MSVFHENMLIGSSGQGGAAAAYTIQRSLRFNPADSPRLSRTPASAGNRKTWTWAGWVKRSGFGAGNYHLFDTAGSSEYSGGYFTSSDAIEFRGYTSSFTWRLTTSSVYRDPSAWYHIVFNFDSANATASERLRIYVNGVRLTVFSSATYPSLNYDSNINNTALQYLGSFDGTSTGAFSGYLADVHLIDGTAHDATAFGQFDANNVWQPKAFSGTYGTNGFKLDFADNSNNTAATLGKDTSGNGLNWTPTNLSVTAGAGNDSLRDSPTSGGTDTGLGGQVTGNYATWNPLDSSGITFSNGNLDIFGIDTGCGATFAPSSGKWYWEITLGTPYVGSGSFYGIFGLSIGRQGSYISAFTGYTGAGVRATTGTGGGTWANGTLSTTQTTWSTGDVLGFAYDADAKTLDVYRNNTKIGSTLTVPTAATTISAHQNGSGTGSNSVANFGSRAFAYTAPSGFKALCDTNLPAPVVAKPNTVMDVLTWTGNGTNGRSITGLNFNPDFVWIKNRSSGTYWHGLWDAIRGTAMLFSNTTNAELAAGSNNEGYVSSLNSDGFSLTVGTSGFNNVNANGSAYVAWAFDAGTTTTTNTAGSITSQVRANASAGFSIVTYTGTGSNGSIGHGLGVSPSLIITKNRTTAGIDWIVYHPTLDSGKVLLLNSTLGQFAPAGGTYGTITSTTYGVTIGSNFGNLNATGDNYVAYCFAPVAGYSSFGSYTGNGSSDGPFVYTGFRPRWIMIKRTDTTGGWNIIDTARSTYNVVDTYLYANQSWQENYYGAVTYLDALSNGFKLRSSTTAELNANGGTYVYASFSEHPFSLARAR